MRTHVVRQGECLATIARHYGYIDPMTIYNHSSNSELRKLRSNPFLLFPGDRVRIPDRPLKVAPCQTGRTHNFLVMLPTKKFRMVLARGDGRALEGIPWELQVLGVVHQGKTGADGVIEVEIDARASLAMLSTNGGTPQPVGIGHLNPMRQADDGGVTGVQARLNNLGYSPGPVDGELGPKTRAAIRRFEEDQGMEPKGDISEALMKKLEQAHGA
jgi:N-acetylmuramoyl-L-alanine amidase